MRTLGPFQNSVVMIKKKGQNCYIYMSRMTLETCNHQCLGSSCPRREHVATYSAGKTGEEAKTVHGAANRFRCKTPHTVAVNRRRSAGKTGTARTKSRTNGPGHLDTGFWSALYMHSTLLRVICARNLQKSTLSGCGPGSHPRIPAEPSRLLDAPERSISSSESDDEASAATRSNIASRSS